MSSSKVSSLTYPVNTGKMEYLWCHTSTNLVPFVYTWTLDNYSHRNEVSGEAIESAYFTIPGCGNAEWFLQLYPKGANEDCKDHTSLFIHHKGQKAIRAKIKMSILNESTNKLEPVRSGLCEFRGEPYGCEKFVKNVELNVEYGLLLNDTLTIRVEILPTKAPVHTEVTCQFYVQSESVDTLRDELKAVLSQQKFTDITFDVRGTQYKAHKAVLAARSPVFDAMFESNLMEQKKGFVEVPDVPNDVFAEMLNFIYTDKVTTLKTMAMELLIVADKYDIQGLKELSEAHLCADISVAQACEILTFADLYNAHHLKAHALNFISSHRANIVLTDGWKQLMEKCPNLFAECATHIASHI